MALNCYIVYYANSFVEGSVQAMNGTGIYTSFRRNSWK